MLGGVFSLGSCVGLCKYLSVFDVMCEIWDGRWDFFAFFCGVC